MKDAMIVVEHRKLLTFAVDCFLQAGFSREDAALIGETLIEADLRGVNTHGVIRIPMYLNRVRGGGIDPKANPRLVEENGNMAIFDACNGMGQVASCRAMKMAIEKAKAATLGICGVRNSNHFGTAAYYSEMAAERHMIGISCSNTEPLMPAPGGGKAVVGNNPVSMAVPTGEGFSLVLDMAASAAAIGKVLLAQKQGVSIPSGWATDCLGLETVDPKRVMDGGMLLPVGGHKGYGLSLMVDVLAGILVGSGFGDRIRSPFTDRENPQNLGHLFVAVDVSRFLPLDQFLTHVKSLYAGIKTSPTAPGVEEVFVPGEIEHITKQKRLKEGIPLPEALVRELDAYAAELGAREIL